MTDSEWVDWVVGALTLVVFVGLLLAACSTRAGDLDRMQRDIQNCILGGGTPRLGPDRSILCLYP